MILSHDQEEAIKLAKKALFEYRQPFFFLAGPAGTGKTTIAKLIASEAKNPIFCAPTGRASRVLAKKVGDVASTIHSLIYTVYTNLEGEPEFTLNTDSERLADCDLLVVDEASMVSAKLAGDLYFFDIPLLLLGDPAQLPPVTSQPVYKVEEADYVLTTVHRQALDNPVIRLATDVRLGKGVRVGKYGESEVLRVPYSEALEAWGDADVDLRLAGTKKTVKTFNQLAHEALYGSNWLVAEGESIISLRNWGIVYNGDLWKATTPLPKGAPELVNLGVEELGGPRKLSFKADLAPLLGQESKYKRDQVPVDLAHAITVHKAQGSEATKVAVIDESRYFGRYRKNHLYTALTRAKEAVTLILLKG